MPKQSEIKQEELQEFWVEFCGYRGKLASIEPDGETETKLVYVTPPLDLNNLFEYAVPKLRGLSENNTLQDIEFHWQGLDIANTVECNLIFDEAEFSGEAEDPALALYQAIQKARRTNEQD